MQTIPITGGAGFIGSYIVERYIRKLLARRRRGRLFLPAAVPIPATVAESAALIVEEADIRTRRPWIAFLPHIVRNCEPSRRAEIRCGFQLRSRCSDQEINGRGFLNVLLACGKYDVGNIVYASSGGVLFESDQRNGKVKGNGSAAAHFSLCRA